jgi:hypothetical protein
LPVKTVFPASKSWAGIYHPPAGRSLEVFPPRRGENQLFRQEEMRGAGMPVNFRNRIPSAGRPFNLDGKEEKRWEG